MASSDSQIVEPQRGHPKRAELPDVNINTDAQSINTERTSKSMQVDRSLQNQNLSMDLLRVAERIRKSARKFTQVAITKAVNFTHMQMTCDQLVSICVGWPNREKLASTCVRS